MFRNVGCDLFFGLQPNQKPPLENPRAATAVLWSGAYPHGKIESGGPFVHKISSSFCHHCKANALHVHEAHMYIQSNLKKSLTV